MIFWHSLPKCDLSKCAVEDFREASDQSDQSQGLENLSVNEPKRPKSPPVVDEDGFEMVKPKSKGKRRPVANNEDGEKEKNGVNGESIE